RLRCAEICGTAHYAMLANVIVLPDDTYQKWLDGEYMLPPDPLFTNAQPGEGYYLDDLENHFTLEKGFVPPPPPGSGVPAPEAEGEG
ncbi:MAG: hypothetical protein AAGA62_15870, partial [Bacteroidota bacterium]